MAEVEIKNENLVYAKPKLITDNVMHYCPGCSHGTVHKLIAEVIEEMGFAEVDHARERRQGFPEVIYGEGKTGEQVLAIMEALAEKSAGSVMATRVSAEKAAFVQEKLPEARYDEVSRILYIERPVVRDPARMILILSAGTSDIPVAEEARLTAHLCGNTVRVHYDCGVAGIHRLFAHKADIEAARVIIVVAGMEGALASGLTTSVTPRPGTRP